MCVAVTLLMSIHNLSFHGDIKIIFFFFFFFFFEKVALSKPLLSAQSSKLHRSR